LALFAVAGLLGMIGQTTVGEEATRGVRPGKASRLIRGLVLFSFASGGYFFTRLFI